MFFKLLFKVMALLSGLAGVYTEAIIKKRPSRNINVQNFFLYDFGMLFSTVAIVTQDFDAMILNQALRCILLQWQCFSKHLSPTFYLVSI
ncbi:CMP-sialic acid transporter 2-like isoform X1 [Castanea sativa]|uniref:CMP-sialic acid transporter 2-like isoform X1 n=1 Tax=Castanea sativa TaxID=21020 RepID=UPI003F649A75